MSTTVCVVANTLRYPNGGGQTWVYLNWALGLRELGCEVLWLEGMFETPVEDQLSAVTRLKRRLAPYGLADPVALWSYERNPLRPDVRAACLSLEGVALQTDSLLSLCYDTPAWVIGRFRRTALVDIDPGLPAAVGQRSRSGPGAPPLVFHDRGNGWPVRLRYPGSGQAVAVHAALRFAA